MVRYVSSRGGVPRCGFEHALLDGLAADGGLYLPESWPRLDRDRLEGLRGASYQEVAASVLAPFVEGALTEAELRDLIGKAYAGFDHVAVAPLHQLDANDWLLELFHGPTLAFKDIALQLLGHLFEQSVTDLEMLRIDPEAAFAPPAKQPAGRRKREGIYYTPRTVTSYIVEHTVGAVLRDRFDALAREYEVDPQQEPTKQTRDARMGYERARLEALRSQVRRSRSPPTRHGSNTSPRA